MSINPVVAESVLTVDDVLNEAPSSRFHKKAILVSGMGFFTDAYDLFVISTVAALVSTQWGLSTAVTSWVTGSAILGAFVGAFIFGRIADLLGRKTVYVTVAVIMIVGAMLSAVAPNVWFLVAARLVLGIGIGGDYPVSAVLMSEYSNRKDRGRHVGLVFAMQAVGLVVGPLVALTLLSSGISHELTWRLLLAFGAIPAAGVVLIRSRMPESPRFQSQVRGRSETAARDLKRFSNGAVSLHSRAVEGSSKAGAAPVATAPPVRMRLSEFVTDPRMLLLLLGTAGSWLLLDYAYYGNTLSLPSILKLISPTASLEAKLAWTLGIFIVFAVPGYLLAVWKMDRIGHKKLQIMGFGVMAVAFLGLGVIGPLTEHVVPFLAVFGLSYFFIQFGPNSTTFVLPSEVFPISVRTTGHGAAAGLGKLGAFIGVFLVPILEGSIGLRGMLVVAAGSAVLGLLVTLVLPEPARRTLEDVSSYEKGQSRRDATIVALPTPGASPSSPPPAPSGSDNREPAATSL
ncbi:MAG: MFS transporter [Acidimicrobiales bacterium]